MLRRMPISFVRSLMITSMMLPMPMTPAISVRRPTNQLSPADAEEEHVHLL
jgi:hypothetical protein